MILSRFELNSNHREARRDLANAYEMHRTVKRLCGESTPLWRLEDNIVLMQSPTEPLWSGLQDGYLQSRNQRPYPIDRLQLEGRELRFRLKANPTITQRPEEAEGKKVRGKRWSLVREEEQKAWLKRQGERAGFEAFLVDVTESQKLNFSKPGSRTFITIHSCVFEGRLRVTDLASFRETLAKGLGSAKAFGMGMLSLAGG